MSDDLVKRLRAAELEYIEGQPVGHGPPINPDGPEAADEIERLSAANAELVKAAKRALPVIADLMPFNPDTDDPSDRLAYDALETAIAKHEGTD